MDNYTRIENQLLEKLCVMGLSGTALSCALILLRKTNGFGKEQDGISLSQFAKLTGKDKRTIVRSLKELQLVSIVTLVSSGKSRKQVNIYKINKMLTEWQLVTKVSPVKKPTSDKSVITSSDISVTQLVTKVSHTKETITKETKEIISKDITTGVVDYGNEDINFLIKYLKEKLEIPSLDGSVKSNRNYCNNLIKRMKKNYPNRVPRDLICKLIDYAVKDNFHSTKVSSFSYLFYNYNKILLEAKHQMENPQMIQI